MKALKRRQPKLFAKFCLLIFASVNVIIYLNNFIALKPQSDTVLNPDPSLKIWSSTKRLIIEEKIDWHDYKFTLLELGELVYLAEKEEIELNRHEQTEEDFAVAVSDLISANLSLPDVRLAS